MRGNAAADVAQMVFAFVISAKTFTEGMDKGDEVKLLRLRTKRSEIVIVPGECGVVETDTDTLHDHADAVLDRSFLHVVIHDTPPA